MIEVNCYFKGKENEVHVVEISCPGFYSKEEAALDSTPEEGVMSVPFKTIGNSALNFVGWLFHVPK